MKHMKGLILVVVLAAAATAWMTAPGPRADYAALQRGDLASMIDGTVNLPTKFRVNAADSGVAVDLANYSAAAVVVAVGKSDEVAGSKYVVLQDSTPGVAAWVNQDSVAVDSVDNRYLDMGYKGSRRYIRILSRATGGAGDTIQVTGIVVRSGKRAR